MEIHDESVSSVKYPSKSKNSMTFQEFKTIMESLRQERWRGRLEHATEEDEAEHSWTNTESDASTEEKSQGVTEQEKVFKKDEESSKDGAVMREGVKEDKQAMKEAVERKELKEEEMSEELVVPYKQQLNKAAAPNMEAPLPVTVPKNDVSAVSLPQRKEEEHVKQAAQETESSAEKSATPTQAENHDKLHEAEPHPSQPQQEDKNEENLVCTADKNCAQCSSFRYHVLASIVCAVWLINFLFVVWVFLCRDNHKTMRIPKGFVRKSSQNPFRHKSLTPSTEPDRGRPLREPNTARSRASIPRLQQQSPEYLPTEVSEAAICEEARKPSPELHMAFHTNKISVLPRNQLPPHELTTRCQRPVSTISSNRAYVTQRTPLGNAPCSLSPIQETSQEERFVMRDCTADIKQGQVKVMEKNESHSRFCDGQNSQRLLWDEGQGPAGRRNYPAAAQMNACNRDVTSNTQAEDRQYNPHLFEKQGYIKCVRRNQVQDEDCGEGVDERLQMKQDRWRPMEGSGCGRDGGTGINYRHIYSQIPLSQDVIPQITPKYAEEPFLSKHMVQMMNSSSRYASDKQRNSEFVDTRSSHPHQQLMRHQVTAATFKYQRPRITSDKSRIHEGPEVEMDDTFETRDKYPQQFLGYVPEYDDLVNKDKDNSSAKHPSDDVNVPLHAIRRLENVGQVSTKKPEVKLREELDNLRTYDKSSRRGDVEAIVPPPPYAYYVRKDSSLPNSNIELPRDNLLACAGDMNAATILNTHESFHSKKFIGPAETNESGKMRQSLLSSQLLLKNQESHMRRQGCGMSTVARPRSRHSKKLLIIGKLNCSNGGHKRKTKSGMKIALGLSEESKNVLCDRTSECIEEEERSTTKMAWEYTPTVAPSNKKMSDNEEKHTDVGSTKVVKTIIASDPFESLEDRVKYYYKALSHAGKHASRLCVKRNGRHRSSLKINNESSLKHVNAKPGAGDAISSHKKLVKAIESQQCLNITSETGQEATCQRCDPKHADLYSRIGLLPSYYMNVNSNAGVPDNCPEGFAGGKTEAKQMSGSSIHSSDQYFSTHTDTEISATCSEMEVSPTPSLTHETEDVTIITQRKSEPILSTNNTTDQIKQFGLEGEEKGENILPPGNESILDKLSKKILEQATSDKIGNLKNENHMSRSQAALSAVPRDSATAVNSRHKKKTKTTEAAIIKFESGVPKKVTSTPVAKDGKKPLSKPRQERSKQLPAPGDVQKAVAVASDKSIKNTVDNARVMKMIKSSEGHTENLETKPRQKPVYETYLDYIALKEPHRQARVSPSTQSQGVRSAESDHRCSPLKNHATTSCKSEDMSQIKRLVSLPKTMPSQGTSYKQYLPLKHHETKSGIIEIESDSEARSSITIKVNMSSSSPVSQKARASLGSSINTEITDKMDVQKTTETDQEDVTRSPTPEFSSSPKRELSNLLEKNEEFEQSILVQKEVTDNKLNKTESLNSLSVTHTVKTAESIVSDKSPETVNVARKKSVSNRKGDSPGNTKEVVLKQSEKRIINKNNEKTSEDVTSKDDQGESSKGKMYHVTPINRKKCLSRYKLQSRSPDNRKKKRMVRKSSNDLDDSKLERVKKQRSVDRLTDKKKKRKKQRQKVSEIEETDAENGQPKMEPQLSRSRSTESNKTTQTILSSVSTPKFLTTVASEPTLSPNGGGKDSKSAVARDRHISSAERVLSGDRDQEWRSEQLKSNKSQTMSSAETVSIVSESDKMTHSAESILTFNDAFTRSSGKVVQLALSSKVRKEKDLQEAELGWNSSTFSSDERVATEKVKTNHKRAMVRYYIVKPKSKKMDKEIVASKLKHPAPRLTHADGDMMCIGSETDANSELVHQEKSKTGQGKSVQFSDNIEDLEAAKEEFAIERSLWKPDHENTPYLSNAKNTIDVTKPQSRAMDVELPAPSKLVTQKKEELRPQVTPPRKRRPIWLKKSVKEKAGGLVKVNTSTKSLPAVGQVKKRHSSDNILKPSSRFNIHVYYPVKSMAGSPKINMSVGDKRKVAYNTLINNIYLAAPMNKATRKLVAKLGSPVDIKEIIEGSSVDAADHFRAMKAALHDGNVRAARSVPSLGLQRPAATESIGGKRIKLSDDLRLASQKNKDLKVRDSASLQSYSVTEVKEDQAMASRRGLVGSDVLTSPSFSTKVDGAIGFKQRNAHKKLIEQRNQRRKEKKPGKKTSHQHATKWQLLTSQDAQSVSDLTQGHYTDDMIEANVLNMGLAWVVQSVVNRLPFMTPRLSQSAVNTPRETSSNHQLVELDHRARHNVHEY